MQSEFFKRHQTNYEELQNKKLSEFYVVVQMVSTELLLGEGTILQPSKVTMLYGLDILRYRKNVSVKIPRFCVQKKVLYLRVENLEKKWSKGSQNWSNVQNQLAILFEDRYTKYI